MKHVYLLLFMLIGASGFYPTIKAQTFPISNATWVFQSEDIFSYDNLAQKWVYMGDSIVSDGIIKKMKVFTKTINPTWFPNDTILYKEDFVYFLYVGDTIWNLADSLSPIANFSVSVGDSIFTPYHSLLSSMYPDVVENSSCSEESSFFFQKGKVVEVGNETIDGINSKFYKLKFWNELKDTIVRKFSERTIITESYWFYDYSSLSCGITDAPIYSFICYNDDFTDNSLCDGNAWFETLHLTEEGKELNVEVYPNPIENYLYINTNIKGDVELVFYDLKGNKILSKKEGVNDTGNIKIDLSHFDSGIYFLSFIANNQLYNFKIIKQ
ncbi:MAG: T9SS type A sorting domain-containing protein [Brumimicrobium sp.]|nr:T9SS type A sorting domain-containing protein [Brumimicrobium sp.]